MAFGCAHSLFPVCHHIVVAIVLHVLHGILISTEKTFQYQDMPNNPS